MTREDYHKFCSESIKDADLFFDLYWDLGYEGFKELLIVDVVYRYFPNIDDEICDLILDKHTIINKLNLDNEDEEFFIKKQIVWFYDDIKTWIGFKKSEGV